MKARKEDNTIFVLQTLIRRFRIRVSDSTIKEFLSSHPYYPTLKSICDAFKKWEVDYYPLKLEPAEIRELERPFIAHLNISGGQLAFVEPLTNGQVSYAVHKGRTLKESFDVFSKKLSGAVILIDKGKNSGEKNYWGKRQHEMLTKSLLPLTIITILLLLLWNLFLNFRNLIVQPGITGVELLITKFIGIAASIFLILKESKIFPRLTEKICHFNSQTDCDAVLSSPASRLFGWINWADAGLIYFTGTLLFLSGIQGKRFFGTVSFNQPSFVTLSYFLDLLPVGKAQKMVSLLSGGPIDPDCRVYYPISVFANAHSSFYRRNTPAFTVVFSTGFILVDLQSMAGSIRETGRKTGIVTEAKTGSGSFPVPAYKKWLHGIPGSRGEICLGAGQSQSPCGADCFSEPVLQSLC